MSSACDSLSSRRPPTRGLRSTGRRSTSSRISRSLRRSTSPIRRWPPSTRLTARTSTSLNRRPHRADRWCCSSRRSGPESVFGPRPVLGPWIRAPVASLTDSDQQQEGLAARKARPDRRVHAGSLRPREVGQCHGTVRDHESSSRSIVSSRSPPRRGQGPCMNRGALKKRIHPLASSPLKPACYFEFPSLWAQSPAGLEVSQWLLTKVLFTPAPSRRRSTVAF